MYCNIFFGTSHTTNRMSFNFTLNRGAFVLEILSPGAGVWDMRRPWAVWKDCGSPGHVTWATAHMRHLAIPLGDGTYLLRSTILLHATRAYLRCLAFTRSRSRRRGLITAILWPTFVKRLRDWPPADVLGNSVGSRTCSTLSQWLCL